MASKVCDIVKKAFFVFTLKLQKIYSSTLIVSFCSYFKSFIDLEFIKVEGIESVYSFFFPTEILKCPQTIYWINPLFNLLIGTSPLCHILSSQLYLDLFWDGLDFFSDLCVYSYCYTPNYDTFSFS